LRLCAFSEPRLDYGGDPTLDDLLLAASALDADPVNARAGRLVDDIPDGRAGPRSRTPPPIVAPDTIAGGWNTLIIESFTLRVEGRSRGDVGDDLPHDLRLLFHEDKTGLVRREFIAVGETPRELTVP
jgi:hypothetical protein